MLPAPWIIDEINRREREREQQRWEPIPLHAPTVDAVIWREDADDDDAEDVGRSTVIVIDLNDLHIIEDDEN
jgi:hypothetical protein